MRGFGVALLWLLAVTAWTAPASPQIVLWAWTTDVDLRQPSNALRAAGVAYLAGEVQLTRADAQFDRRVRPLRLPRATERTAVVFVRVARGYLPPSDDASLDRLAADIRALPMLRDAQRVQLDFEATESQRVYWHRLVAALRAALPARQRLDVAVLASWCLSPDFAVTGVERVIPMLYRMGRRDAALDQVLAGRADFAAPACRAAIGISTDELDRVALGILRGRRWLYVFAPGGWQRAGHARLAAWLAQ